MDNALQSLTDEQLRDQLAQAWAQSGSWKDRHELELQRRICVATATRLRKRYMAAKARVDAELRDIESKFADLATRHHEARKQASPFEQELARRIINRLGITVGTRMRTPDKYADFITELEMPPPGIVLEYRGYDFHYNTPVFGQVRKSDGKVGARWYGVTPDHIALLTKV